MPKRSDVLKSMGCGEESSFYESAAAEFDLLFERVRNALDLRRTIFSDGERIYVTLTAGGAISGLSEELFAKGEGLAGLIANNCADDALFRADEDTARVIKYLCARLGRGIARRLEAPADIPFSEQAVILEKAPVEGVTLTEAFMLSPSKSLCYELILSDDEEDFRAQHDCSKCPNKGCPRRSSQHTAGFYIISDFDREAPSASGVAVDIGTTTVAAIRLEKGRVAAAHSELNAGRRFGADVLSRIESAAAGRGAELRSIMEYQLKKCVEAVGGADERTVIAANTTMVSLLMGYDCSGLGRYPFRAPELNNIHKGNRSIVGGISAFVGGDITSGLYMCGFDESRDINLFIDLGTNGEMAIGNREGILCTSTAAGPAFEGGRISCGTGSAEGAVCAVSLREGRIETIGGKPPAGICGTGIVELVAELLEAGIIDETGRYIERYAGGYELAPGIVFTQKDVRELQTAKAAVRAGIETLIEEYGAADGDIRHVYIAGGFGRRLNIEKACRVGLLPKRFSGRTRAVGNSALGGCAKLLENEDGFSRTDSIRAAARDFQLAKKRGFERRFMEYMYF